MEVSSSRIGRMSSRTFVLRSDSIPYTYPLQSQHVFSRVITLLLIQNWGLVTYREVDLLIDAVKASNQQKQRVAIVVAHELAHMWFGNLVTMQVRETRLTVFSLS